MEEILEERGVSSQGLRHPRGVKRAMSNFPLRPCHISNHARIEIAECLRILYVNSIGANASPGPSDRGSSPPLS